MSSAGHGTDFNWQGQKVLVTGASGFKGSWLCGILVNLGAEVYGTVRNRIHPESPYELLDLHDEIVEASADISDRQQVFDLINSIQPTVIFHLAAKAIVPVALSDPRRAFEVNVLGTVNILEACRTLRRPNRRVCERLLICSTDHVFGDLEKGKLPIPESESVKHSGPYETSKAAMELAVRCYHKHYRDELPRLCITRCANVFGFADIAPRRIIPEFMQKAYNMGEISYNTGQDGRQFIHVADAVSGYILAVARGVVDDSPTTPTFHFSIDRYPGTTDLLFIRVHELAELVAKATKKSVNHDNKDKASQENPMLALDCEETKRKLGWRPQKSFVDSLDELARRWYHPSITDEMRKGIIKEAVVAAAALLKP